MNFQMLKLDLEKAEKSEINIHWIIKKAREFQKNIYFCFIDYAKFLEWVDHNKLYCIKRRELYQEIGIPVNLTCILRNLCASQEATVRTGHGTTDWFQIRKRVYSHPAYLTHMQSTSCKMLGWMKHKLESRLLGEMSKTSDDTTLMVKSIEELKSTLMKVKEESENVGLKLNIQKTKIMASGLITSWHIDGKKMETVREFILGGCKITADGNFCHEIKRSLFLGRKAMTNLDSILKSRHYFTNEGPSSQSHGFSSSHVWM